MRHLIAILLLSASVVACEAPPATVFIGSTAKSGTSTPAGNNAVGESCERFARTGGGADIYCGSWKQPSAEVHQLVAAGLPAAATRLRGELEQRASCGDAQSASVLGQAALRMSCTLRAGGFPYIAVVTQSGGNMWAGDGIEATEPVLARVIAELSGRSTAGAETAGTQGQTAERLASRALKSGDIGQYDELIRAGKQANRAGEPDKAEKAYRAAVDLQDKVLPGENPGKASAVMALALQLSDQERFGEADRIFTRARGMVPEVANPNALDRNARPRLLLYRALHERNQGHLKEAIALFDQAEQAFHDIVPDARETAPASRRVSFFSAAPGGGATSSFDNARPYQISSETEAQLGILESRRNKAVTLRLMGDAIGSEREAQSAATFASANGLTSVPNSARTARLWRSQGIASAAAGQLSPAVSLMNSSTEAASIVLRGSRMQIDTELARAAVLGQGGDSGSGRAACRSAISVLWDTRATNGGVDGKVMQPCLSAFARGGQDQAELTEMFLAAQFIRSSITANQIQQAAARLSESSRNPAAGKAIRALQDIDQELTGLAEERAKLLARPDSTTQSKLAEVDKRDAAVQLRRSEAEQTLQAASPNYGQLTQQVVRAEDIFAVLRPGEAFVAIVLSENEGWTFVLRDQRIAMATVPGGLKTVTPMVKALRTSIEPRNDNTIPDYDIATARGLYDLVLGSNAKALEGVTAMTIAPAGPLLSMPFEILLTGPADAANLGPAPWLGRRFTIAHVPGAANFIKLRGVRSTATKPWLGFGDFRPISLPQAQRTFPGDACRKSATDLAGLSALAGTQRELATAAKIYSANPGEVITGQAFTAAAVQAARLQDYQILHFAAHAVLPAEIRCQDEPAIVTSAPAGAGDARGALLTSSLIQDLKLSADLVLLSACNTGGPGGDTAGESLAGLARSFFYAGARALVVSHWDVDDQTATYLMASTLLRYKTAPADGIAKALQAAQVSLLDDAEIPVARKHPYYWAPFALIGEGGGTAAKVAGL